MEVICVLLVRIKSEHRQTSESMLVVHLYFGRFAVRLYLCTWCVLAKRALYVVSCSTVEGHVVEGQVGGAL